MITLGELLAEFLGREIDRPLNQVDDFVHISQNVGDVKAFKLIPKRIYMLPITKQVRILMNVMRK